MGLGYYNQLGQAYSYLILFKAHFLILLFCTQGTHVFSVKCSLIFPGRIPHPFNSAPRSSLTRFHNHVVDPFDIVSNNNSANIH